MLQFDESATKDECGNSWSATGSPSLSTNAKFGGNAISVDNDNYIQLENFYIGGKDFTIDYWAYVTGIATLFSMKNGDSLFQYYYDDFESWFLNSATSANYKSHIPFSKDTWHHTALVYQHSAGTVKTFVDGSLAATFTEKNIPYGDYSPVCIGKNIRIGETAALIDELRISDVIARWTENFTPPTEPYVRSQNYAGLISPTDSLASDIFIHLNTGIKAIAKRKKTPTLTFSKDSATIFTKTSTDSVTFTTNSDGAASVSCSGVCTGGSVSGSTVTVSYVTADTEDTETAIVSVTIAETSEFEAITASFTVYNYHWGALNECTPAQIQTATRLGIAPLLWSVGDVTAGIKINQFALGSNTNFSTSTWYAKILGFDHNKDLETAGQPSIHFALATHSNGKDIAIIDTRTGNGTPVYGNSSFISLLQHKTTASNSGGWNSSKIKTFLSGTLLSSIDSAWTDVMADVTKYTDNTGGTSGAEANVTATTGKLFIPSYYEVSGISTANTSSGVKTCTNTFEVAKQAQYDYYKNGASPLRYKHNATSTACTWWLRSPSILGTQGYLRYNSSGVGGGTVANTSFGVVPCFAIA